MLKPLSDWCMAVGVTCRIVSTTSSLPSYSFVKVRSQSLGIPRPHMMVTRPVHVRPPRLALSSVNATYH